jgi:hypothetical protein
MNMKIQIIRIVNENPEDLFKDESKNHLFNFVHFKEKLWWGTFFFPMEINTLGTHPDTSPHSGWYGSGKKQPEGLVARLELVTSPQTGRVCAPLAMRAIPRDLVMTGNLVNTTIDTMSLTSARHRYNVIIVHGFVVFNSEYRSDV